MESRDAIFTDKSFTTVRKDVSVIAESTASSCTTLASVWLNLMMLSRFLDIVLLISSAKPFKASNVWHKKNEESIQIGQRMTVTYCMNAECEQLLKETTIGIKGGHNCYTASKAFRS